MINIYDEVNTLDKKCYEKYFLSEDILMEHAALAMYNHIVQNLKKNSNILIVCGGGNNGADGVVLARLLYLDFNVKLFIAKEPKSNIAQVQKKRTLSLGINTISSIDDIRSCDLIVDCLFGSGFNYELNSYYKNIINTMNNIYAYKISCDIPSGININGQINSFAFIADTTITMGALKKCLYTDNAKNYVGKIIRANLGINEKLYEDESLCFLLEKSDLNLPLRKTKNTNKGSFGHLLVVLGEKQGAGLITSHSAFAFGVGLISAYTNKDDLPYDIMYTNKIPKNTTCIALGMGLGEKFDYNLLDNNIPLLIDADLFYNKIILDILKKDNIVLTPHPKEFCSLLNICDIATIDIKTLQDNRFYYVNKFCKKYPKAVLLLKGANVIIQKNDKAYINHLGTPSLSFAGSGDVLAGLIASLIAQGYNCLDATIQGSLAHTISALNFKGNDYSLNPKDLIEQIKIL